MKENSIKNICVFCGANDGNSSLVIESAKSLGARLAQEKFGLIYGGGKVGLMGTIADAALENQGYVMGVIPELLVSWEVAHKEVSELVVVRSMHERKAKMAAESQAFIAMPGGFGTLDELNEIITWKQIGYHNKPIVILNVDNYFDGFLHFIDYAVGKGFIKSHHREMIRVETTVEDVIQYLKSELK